MQELAEHWSSLFLKDCTPWKGTLLEQFLENCRPWEGPTLEKLVQDCLQWRGICEEKGAAETSVMS